MALWQVFFIFPFVVCVFGLLWQVIWWFTANIKKLVSFCTEFIRYCGKVKYVAYLKLPILLFYFSIDVKGRFIQSIGFKKFMS